MKERNGTPDYEKYPEFFCSQYWDKDVKAFDGESQREVNNRMTEAFWEVVENNRNKKSVIVSHGTSISFLLMNWCKLLNVEETLLRKFEFKGKTVINRIYKAPEVFKILIDDRNNIIDVTNIEFEDI